MTKIKANKVVIISYTLRSSAGDVIDQSEDGSPMVYLHGAQNIVPGLEEELEGVDVGETLQATVPPEKGYGPRVGDAQSVPRSSFPEGAQLEPGMRVIAQDEAGQQIPFFVTEVTPELITIDLNHPLAGETLHFEVTVEATRDATDEELEHGHPHGPGGHHH